MDRPKFKTPKQIEKELSQIEKGESRSWGNLFLLLVSIEQTKFWIREEDSFTRWVENNAFRLHTKPAMLWRILSAGRFVLTIAERYKDQEFYVPPLEVMSDAVSPENIELLSKLDRVTADDTFVDLARRVFAGRVKRSELRGAWETYRPVLKGRTARGRGVAAPRLNQKDPDQYRSFLEVLDIDAFQAAGPEWMGIKSPSFYKVFVHVDPEGQSQIGMPLFAAVVVVRHKDEPVKYHGVRNRPLYPFPKSSYDTLLDYCDYLWVLNPAAIRNIVIPEDWDDLLPNGIGILAVREGKVTVIKPAGTVEGAGTKRLSLASALLIRASAAK